MKPQQLANAEYCSVRRRLGRARLRRRSALPDRSRRFYLATAIYPGELDLAELQQRSQPRASRASR